ncbi:hypothetical protein NQ318_010974 [Aromia moschata]|uniref:Uncharacterized protein n=1 Tax=Aromia moschata TaxID=1265417 RepID=A0AAV8YJY8_9CUCU|nr:hypothetical protein NQ318_010974 [Aromia moschata]
MIHFYQFNRPCIWLPSKDDDVEETHINKGDVEEAHDESGIRNIWTHESTLGLISTYSRMSIRRFVSYTQKEKFLEYCT